MDRRHLRMALRLAPALLVATMAAAGTPPVLTLAPAGEPGERLVVTGQLLDRASLPIAGARLHVYHTDASGRYTRERAMDEPHARLGGWVTSDAEGRFELHTIRPGRYPNAVHMRDRDRLIPAHIHIDAESAGHPGHRWQAVFADDSVLTDPYWQDWVKKLGQPVLTAKRDAGVWRAALRLVLE